MFNRSRLHIGDIAPTVTEADLRALFEQAGEVEALNIPVDSNNRHKGFAFIEMKDGEGANEAIHRFNGFTFHGHTLFVFSVPPRSSKRGDSKAEYRRGDELT